MCSRVPSKGKTCLYGSLCCLEAFVGDGFEAWARRAIFEEEVDFFVSCRFLGRSCASGPFGLNLGGGREGRRDGEVVVATRRNTFSFYDGVDNNLTLYSSRVCAV